MKNMYNQKVGALVIFCLFTVFSFNLFSQVGIGTTSPITTLDVNGAISLREGPTITHNSGNINLTPSIMGSSPYSQYRITATGNYSINMIAPLVGTDGQILILINDSDYTLTLNHNVGGNMARRIYCPGEQNLVLNGRYATVSLQYNTILGKWIVVDFSDIRYGDGIISVKGTTDISTNSNTFTDMQDMSVTFTPKHTTVYVSFSASGHMNTTILPESSYAQFRLVNVTAGNTTQAGVTTLVTDYDFDDVWGEIVAVSWNANIGMFPVSVNPGVATTLKIQWLRDGVYPTRLLCNVSTLSDQAHRSLTVFD